MTRPARPFAFSSGSLDGSSSNELRAAAQVLKPVEILLLAGQIASRLDGQESLAGQLFAFVVRSNAGATAPAAELEWARLLVRQSQPADAVAHLEHLILTYPASAVVPDARRELERAKGAIPRS